MTAYEPDRLVAVGDDRLIELRNAKPQHLVALAEYDPDPIWRALVGPYRSWAVAEIANGRANSDITFDAYVRTTGVWRPGAD